jgi:hypothetical protein
MKVPVRERFRDCLDPSTYSGLAGIYFLSTSDETHDSSPIRVSVHAGDQELRFGLIEAWAFLLPGHEVGRLLVSPRALGFIEDYDMVMRRPGVDQSVVSEVVNVLYKGLNALSDLTFRNAFTCRFAACDFIACESL